MPVKSFVSDMVVHTQDDMITRYKGTFELNANSFHVSFYSTRYGIDEGCTLEVLQSIKKDEDNGYFLKYRNGSVFMFDNSCGWSIIVNPVIHYGAYVATARGSTIYSTHLEVSFSSSNGFEMLLEELLNRVSL